MSTRTAVPSAPTASGSTSFNPRPVNDPVLPSSPEDEHLTPVAASQSTPSSYFTSSRESSEPPAEGSGATVASYNYGADFGETSFNDDFLFTSAFNNFLDSDGANAANTSGPTTAEPASATSLNIPLSRHSTGIATHSSQLMSPELSDAASPESIFESPLIAPTSDPTYTATKTRLLGGGEMSRVSSQSTAVESQEQHQQRPMIEQQTPAPTGSNTSPDSRFEATQALAPTFRVESYSRGDSPMRSNPGDGTRAKRSHEEPSNTHLIPDPDAAHAAGIYQAYEEPELSAHTGPRLGLDPLRRVELHEDYVPSLVEQEEKKKIDAKNVQVSHWLATSSLGSLGALGPGLRAENSAAGMRRRAKSSSGLRELQADAFALSRGLRAQADARIIGPGVLIDEDSPDDESSAGMSSHDPDAYGEADDGLAGGVGDAMPQMDVAESPPACVDEDEVAPDEPCTSFPAYKDSGIPPEAAYPWIDSIYFPSEEGAVGQPPTSNAAIMRFAKKSRDLETASRAATWGTRRMSDGDIQLQRVFGSGGLLARFSISKDRDKDKDKDKDQTEWRQFKGIVDQAANKFFPKRSNSRKRSEPVKLASQDPMAYEQQQQQQQQQQSAGRYEGAHGRKESLQSLGERKARKESIISRIPSGRRPKSPKINTGTVGLIAAGATRIAGLGVNGPVSPTLTQSGSIKRNFRNAREKVSRNSSYDTHDVTYADTSSQPTSITAVAVAAAAAASAVPRPITSPPKEHAEVVNDVEDDADSDEQPRAGERGTPMDLTPRKERIIPTFDGFKMHIRDVNPRLPPWLVERLGQEQLRRYKKLVEFKVKHAQAKILDNCESKAHCVDKGGVPTYFPSKASQKEPSFSHTGFSAGGTGDADDDDDAVNDGAVTDAQFPSGVPVPPAKRLPAEFECPLCFTVKKFQKPSDWSKHVHEDLQPFTCTFLNCPDPKSFKRKADWVRHENERHRQLEWWQCTEEGCSHQCFRRDNFVQHLVREHKMPEPKAKTTSSSKPAVRGPAKKQNRGGKAGPGAGAHEVAPEDRVLMMVETCRNENNKNAIDEPCSFCGNVCNTFKKLTVHLARHMEQISMPVLELVKQREVSADTVISPIETKLSQFVLPSTPQQQQQQHPLSTLTPQSHAPPTTTAGYHPNGMIAGIPPYDHRGAGQPIELSNGLQHHGLPGNFTPITAAGPAATVAAYYPHQQSQQQQSHSYNGWATQGDATGPMMEMTGQGTRLYATPPEHHHQTPWLAASDPTSPYRHHHHHHHHHQHAGYATSSATGGSVGGSPEMLYASTNGTTPNATSTDRYAAAAAAVAAGANGGPYVDIDVDVDPQMLASAQQHQHQHQHQQEQRQQQYGKAAPSGGAGGGRGGDMPLSAGRAMVGPSAGTESELYGTQTASGYYGTY